MPKGANNSNMSNNNTTTNNKTPLLGTETVNHPQHYGGDSPLEAIKVIEYHNLGFCLGNVVKYVLRSDKKGNQLQDLKKAKWYLDREIAKLERSAKIQDSIADFMAGNPPIR